MKPLAALLFALGAVLTLAVLAAVTVNYGARVGFAVAVVIALPIIWLDERRRERNR